MHVAVLLSGPCRMMMAVAVALAVAAAFLLINPCGVMMLFMVTYMMMMMRMTMAAACWMMIARVRTIQLDAMLLMVFSGVDPQVFMMELLGMQAMASPMYINRCCMTRGGQALQVTIFQPARCRMRQMGPMLPGKMFSEGMVTHCCWAHAIGDLVTMMLVCLVAVPAAGSRPKLGVMEIVPQHSHAMGVCSMLGCRGEGSQVGGMGVGQLQLVACRMSSRLGHSRGSRAVEVLLMTVWVMRCTRRAAGLLPHTYVGVLQIAQMGCDSALFGPGTRYTALFRAGCEKEKMYQFGNPECAAGWMGRSVK